MAFRSHHFFTGEIIPATEIKDLVDSHKYYYEFDSGEEALLEIVIKKRTIPLGDKTIRNIDNIKRKVSLRGVNLDTYFTWRDYIFSNLGRFYTYIGEMEALKSIEVKPEEVKQVQDKIIVPAVFQQKPNLNQIDWNLYSVEEKAKIFEILGNNLGFGNNDSENLKRLNDYADEEEINALKSINRNLKPTLKTVLISELDKIKGTVIYKLYCERTPNICYIGRTKNLQERYYAHYRNSTNGTNKFKREWIDYIKEKNYYLRIEVLNNIKNNPLDNGMVIENKLIQKHVDNKENVVLNFTHKSYTTTNMKFNKRFKECLYQKRVRIINDYYDEELLYEDAEVIEVTDNIDENLLNNPSFVTN